jgi:outer membrane protein OmpA-like peptidoglycan-associated protein
MELINGRTRADWARYDGTHKVVAILLAILLAILWFMGKGLTTGAACCGAASVATAPPPVAPIPTAASSLDLRFTNDNGKVTLAGVVADDATRKSIVDQATASFGADNVIDQLKVIPNAAAIPFTAKLGDIFGWVKTNTGNAMVAKERTVTLLGSVPAEADKKGRGEWAANTFAGIAVDNQLVVKAAGQTMPLPAKLYFETAKTDLPADASDLIAPVIAFAKANPEVRVAISGFHDPRGNKATNEELAKNRAKAVKALLMQAGIAENRIDMLKPAETTGSGYNKEARRVEVSIAL